MRQSETADAVGALVNAPSAAATCSNANDPTTLEDARIGSLWTRGTAFRFFHSMRFKLPSSRSWWYQPWDHTNDALKKRCVDIVASYDGRAPPVYATLITATRLAPGVMWLHAKVQGNANVTVAREVMLLPLDSVATVLSGCPTIGARVPRLLSMSHDREIVVQMCNPTPDTVSLPSGLPLGRVLFNPPSNNEESAVASFLSDAANDVAPSRRADLREQVLERLVLRIAHPLQQLAEVRRPRCPAGMKALLAGIMGRLPWKHGGYIDKYIYPGSMMVYNGYVYGYVYG